MLSLCSAWHREASGPSQAQDPVVLCQLGRQGAEGPCVSILLLVGTQGCWPGWETGISGCGALEEALGRLLMRRDTREGCPEEDGKLGLPG